MHPTFIYARDLPEAWFRCVQGLGKATGRRIYTIDSGSYAGQRRLEYDLAVIQIKQPGTRPLVPDVPLGVPPPTTMEYIEKDYYPNYIMGVSDPKKTNETYTYGDDIVPQIAPIIDLYQKEGSGTNQACMSVGNSKSIHLEHSQCLRVIDTCIRYGALHFVVYFRSWDLWGGFPANLAGIQLLKESMASAIGAEDGELLAVSKGLHLYDHCWDVANAVLRSNVIGKEVQADSG